MKVRIAQLRDYWMPIMAAFAYFAVPYALYHINESPRTYTVLLVMAGLVMSGLMRQAYIENAVITRPQEEPPECEPETGRE